MGNNYPVKGSELQVSAAGSTTFVAIGQLKSVDGPGESVGKREITHLGSATKQYESTIADLLPISGTLILDPSDATHQTLMNRVTTPSTGVSGGSNGYGDLFKLVWPTTTKYIQFYGFTEKFEVKGGDVEGTYMADFSIQPTRALTWPTT